MPGLRFWIRTNDPDRSDLAWKYRTLLTEPSCLPSPLSQSTPIHVPE
uniref:Uncharacterized protein MANES_18G118300 n=1 Tax=Rhizophora mucronata TaxID=61149 RepID=A0A2P2KMS2_RHIMU